MNIDSKVWDTTKTGTKVHAFGADGTALCRSSIRHNIGDGQLDKASAVRWVLMHPKLSICETCEGRFQGLIDADAVDQAQAPAPVRCCDHASMYHGARGCDLCACTTDRSAMTAQQDAPVIRALVNPEVAPEVIRALALIRSNLHGMSNTVTDAFNALDNAGIFAAVDAASKRTCLRADSASAPAG